MDKTLERLKRKRMLELQRMLLEKQTEEHASDEEKKEPSSEELLGRFFVGRAWEIWNLAKAQYPSVMPKIEAMLVSAIKQNKINQKIDGASLAQFFRQVGIPIRLQTRIRYAEHGELKTIEEKLKEK